MKKRPARFLLQFQRRIFFCCCISLFSFFSSNAQTYCVENRFSQTAPFDSSTIRIETGIVYGYALNPFSGMREALALDLYYPEFSADPLPQRPLVVYTHGGSFMAGSRKSTNYYAFEMARRGYVGASIDYRYGWNCNSFDPCTDCVQDTGNLRIATYMAAQDLLAALRFLSANAGAWRIDPGSVFLSGISAGAITTFAAASWTQRDAENFAPGASALLGGINESGNDENGVYTVRGIASICGGFPGDSTGLNALHVPVICFHDEFDCLVPFTSGPILACDCPVFYPACGPVVIQRNLLARGFCSRNFTNGNSHAHCSSPSEYNMLHSADFFKSILCSECGSNTAEDFSAKVNPVPADKKATVQFADYAHHGGTIHCLNGMGQELFKQVYHEFDAQAVLNTEGLAPGVYYLLFECVEKPATLKMLVVHP